MIISWNWLKQYVPLDMPVEELTRRLMMAGLNHESTEEVAGDLAIDLEVTSNRPDCLGHLGIARETAVLFGQKLTLPAANPPEDLKTPVGKLVKVRIECPELCMRYTARVVRGVKIGPSPKWMVRRLETVGQTSVNNVVDISNYVMLECGQPLHTFDFGKLQGGEIVVRRPCSGETIEAIDHKTYALGPEMCMICDSRDPVAIGGVMGGAQTEISSSTRDVLVEAAEFAPVSIRNTARQLNLHSDSSYRFERMVDPEGLDWASRRCCELILELAGGELAAGVVDVGQAPPVREPITLRFSQLKRILGIDVPADRVREILLALGNEERSEVGGQGAGKVASGQWPVASENNLPSPGHRPAGLVGGRGAGGEGGQQLETVNHKSEIINQKSLAPSPQPLVPNFNPQSPIPNLSSLTVIAPSWRRDLTREIDLIEEVARIYGYEAIPEDVSVPMAPSAKRREDRVFEKIRHALTASGIDEAMTLSVVDEKTSSLLSPWTDAEPLRSSMPVIRGADYLRRSLMPSLLAARRTNEALANTEIELFEIAKVYLPRVGELPSEEIMLAITSGRDYAAIKGIIESLAVELKINDPLEADDACIELFDPSASCRLKFRGEVLGYVGRLTPEALHRFDLRGNAVVAEIKLKLLVDAADLVPRYAPQSPYPAVTRDLNLVVDESVRWADVAATVRHSGGPHFESLDYCDTYRDAQRLGSGKKSLLFSIALRSADGTLTSQQADEVRDRVVAVCREKHGAELRA